MREMNEHVLWSQMDHFENWLYRDFDDSAEVSFPHWISVPLNSGINDSLVLEFMKIK